MDTDWYEHLPLLDDEERTVIVPPGVEWEWCDDEYCGVVRFPTREQCPLTANHYGPHIATVPDVFNSIRTLRLTGGLWSATVPPPPLPPIQGFIKASLEFVSNLFSNAARNIK